MSNFSDNLLKWRKEQGFARADLAKKLEKFEPVAILETPLSCACRVKGNKIFHPAPPAAPLARARVG